MEEKELNIRGILGFLKRRFRIIVTTLIACVGLAGLAAFALTPVYTASALILVDPSRNNLLDPDARTSTPAADSARVDSEVEILRSQNVLTNVVLSNNLITDDEFGVRLGMRDRILTFLRLSEPQLPTGETAFRSVLDRLQASVSVQRRAQTHLITLQVRSQSPQKAAELANAIAEAYIDDQLNSKIEGVVAATEILNARLAFARQNILASEEQFDVFITENIDQLATQPGSSVAQLRSSLDRVSEELEQLQSRTSVLDTAVRQQDWGTLVAQLESDAATELERQRQALQNLSTLGSGSPTATNIREELAAIELALAQQAETEIAGLSTEVLALDEQAGELRRQIRTEALSSDLPLEVLTRFYELQQSADLARRQYLALLARSGELQVQADLQIADSRIVSYALSPTNPSFPNRRLILILAGLAGIGLGIGLAFVYENFVGGFTSESQLGMVTKLPVISDVPLQKPSGEGGSAADALIAAPLSQFSEAIRRARAGIDRHLHMTQADRTSGIQPESGLVIMVTSSVPNEGKSAVALSLARTYALSGRKSLIVDCDLRRPTLHRNLGAEPETGLLEFLAAQTGTDDFASITLTDKDTGLSLIAGSRYTGVPTDQLITGRAFADLIASARQNYEIVILDTPPILPLVDGLYLSQHADAIVFVVKWSSTPQTEVRNALERIGETSPASAPILAVLSQHANGRSRYDRAYRDYYVS